MSETKPHQPNCDGVFTCDTLGKYAECVTTRQGFAACGHCMKFLVTREGERVAFTVKDMMLKRRLTWPS